MLTLKYLSENFRKFVSEAADYQEAFGLVRENSEGGIWLIGGTVYRTLVQSVYGLGKTGKDFDFLVDRATQVTSLPKGWAQIESRFGNLKFVRGDRQVDFVPLNRVIHIRHYQLPPTIGSFLARTPFNIHSLAYDTRRRRLIGKIGKAALEEKVIRVNDLEMARNYARMYETSVNDKLKETAGELGFSAELI